jgi:hypothetical protein
MGNKINFNELRYIELLKKEEIFKNQGISSFDVISKEGFELLSYRIIIKNQIYYNRKD